MGSKYAVTIKGVVAACALAVIVGAAGCGGRRNTPDPRMSVQTIDWRRAYIVGGRGTMVYHHCDCVYAKNIPEKDLVGYGGVEDAAAAGKIPCAVCEEKGRFRNVPEPRPLPEEPNGANEPADGVTDAPQAAKR